MIGRFMKANMPLITGVFFALTIFSATAQAQYDLYGLWARKTGVFADHSGISVSQMITDNAGN
ncbi:MAG: hypothetical protein LBC98_09335, partial [Prevotellaceae bacterium]|nr:hypothetical protein [Prevotellaceae bacterium]